MEQEHKMTKAEIKAQRRLEKLARSSNPDSGNKMKTIIIALGSLLFLGFFALVIFLIKQDQNKPIVLAADGYAVGPSNAKVTVVEFGDLQCPACKAYEPFVRQIRKDYAKNVKLIYKNFPLTSVHPNAMLAARAAVSAGNQGKFYEMHDLLYDKQEEWADLPASGAKDKIMGYAASLKLDMDKFAKDIDDSKTEDVIKKTQDEGIAVGVSGTPTFFVDNVKIENPQSYQDFQKIIDNNLKKSSKLQ
ncbi:MAG TPA: thioredoxin domain-containing protein [Patescibacteria group bacterium]|nr:thioredoxin domain-containing protein [Patescibacteria group bacterium]